MSAFERFSDWLRQSRERTGMIPQRARGKRGEDYAHRYLQRRGYRVIARNYQTPSGGNEADIIAWHGEHLVFVEVKTRASDETGTPDRAVTPEKQRRVIRAAMDFSRRAKVEWGYVRFDVVAITEHPKLVIELYPDAFGLAQSL